MMVKWIRKKVK